MNEVDSILPANITDAPRTQEFEGKNLSFLAVSRSGFTDDSKGFANEHGIELVDGLSLCKELLEYGIIGLTLGKDGYKIIGKDEAGKAVYYDRDQAKHIIE